MRHYVFFSVISAALLLAGCKPDDPIIPSEASAPVGVRLLDADSNSLTFVWDEVKDAAYYIGRLETESGELAPSGQTSTKETSISYNGLEADRTYVFKVKAKVGNLESPYSAPVSAITEGPVAPPPGPQQPETSDFYAEFMIPSVEDAHRQALAFPGAEGGGMYTSGGRGGKVIHVTSLADSGAGSLRAALAESGARTIVFDVAGNIELKSSLVIRNGDVTIAGQTAPGDGICISNYDVRFQDVDNVIIRYLRFRMGDAAKAEADALWGRYNRNIIIDHCSMSWSTDECSSFYANEFFTMQWCVLTESLKNSIHGKGSHGYGGIWGGREASFHHNLLANHDSRNPRIDHPQIYDDYISTHRGNVDVRNNAVYNWGANHTYGGEDGWFNIVNNYYKPGPASSDRKYFVDAYGSYVKDGKVYADSYPDLYLSGNVNTRHQDLTDANDVSSIYWHNGDSYGNYNTLLASPLPISGPMGKVIYTTTHVAEDAFERILENCGASLKRDPVDERACTDARNGSATFNDGGNGSKGGIIDTQTAVGGWPEYKASSSELERVKDSDKDGIPDWFEDHFKMDKDDPSDASRKSLDQYGRYTNFEMYLHYLVRDITARQNIGGEYQKLS